MKNPHFKNAAITVAQYVALIVILLIAEQVIPSGPEKGLNMMIITIIIPLFILIMLIKTLIKFYKGDKNVLSSLIIHIGALLFMFLQ
ncbi:MAG: hypothetical protein HRT71_20440 [Flavobacteriales bacterium]|nr:hypothetical protein [Flavobacteriales bacterium]